MLLSHIYRSLSSTIKAPPHAYFSSSSATASSSSLAQRHLRMTSIKEFVEVSVGSISRHVRQHSRTLTLLVPWVLIRARSRTRKSLSSPSHTALTAQRLKGTLRANTLRNPSKSSSAYAPPGFSSLDGMESLILSSRLDLRDDGSAIQDYLKEKTGARSVPRTFISRCHFFSPSSSPLIVLHPGGKSVGGNDDLHDKPKNEVDALIAKRS
jgi:glutaredoxin